MIRSALILLITFAFSYSFAQQTAGVKSTPSTNPKIAVIEVTKKAIPVNEYHQASEHKIATLQQPEELSKEQTIITMPTITAIPVSARTITGSSHKKIVTVVGENSQTIATEKNSNLTQISSEKKPTMRYREATKVSTKVRGTELPKRVIKQTIEIEKNHEE